MHVRRTLISTTALAALLAGAAPAAAVPAVPPPPPHGVSVAGQTAEHASLRPLVELITQRLLLADKVAAAKYGTTKPIDDPARERALLDQVRQRARAAGLDPATAERFFRIQIETNKVVQRGLYARWDAHPEQRPHRRPDLDTEVRPQLDRITDEAVHQLKDTEQVRTPTSPCHMQLSTAMTAARIQHHLDALHWGALQRSVTSICG